MTTDESPKSTRRSRSLAGNASLGATEWLFLLGLLMLSIGISMEYSIGLALIVTGAVLVAASEATAIIEMWMIARLKDKR